MLYSFWKFSRPHTIIGTILSMVALLLLASSCKGVYPTFALTSIVLISALSCNLFIVGLNQYYDIEIDKINKPYLPLASGEFTKSRALRIIAISLLISLIFSWLVDPFFFLLILLINMIGAIYSTPIIKLKKHHITASLAITGVRGFLVNYGIGSVFINYFNCENKETTILWALTTFMILFSIGIAWLKDMYDVDGDKKHNIKTLAIVSSPTTVYYLANFLVIVGLIFSIIIYSNVSLILFYSHILMLFLFILYAHKFKPSNKQEMFQFYKYYWVFFFLEYLIVIAYSIGNMNN